MGYLQNNSSSLNKIQSNKQIRPCKYPGCGRKTTVGFKCWQHRTKGKGRGGQRQLKEEDIRLLKLSEDEQ